MKKIILLYDFLKEPGGLERVMATQARILQKNYSVELSFAFLDMHSEVSKLFQGSKYASHGRFFQNSSLRIMASFLFPKLEDADLYISHSFISSFIAYRKKLFFGKPYVIYFHHPPIFLYLSPRERSVWSRAAPYRKIAFFIGILGGFLLRPLDKIVVRNADYVFVNSEYTKKRMQKLYGREAIVCYPSLSNRFSKRPPWLVLRYFSLLIASFSFRNAS